MKKITAGKRDLVLVADQDAGVKELARDILELLGHRVMTAGTKGDVLLLCEQFGKHLSVVLLDSSLSEPSEIEMLIEHILKRNPATKVIVTSIYSHDWKPGDILGRGASGFLKKPYRITELMHVLERVEDQ